jgi:hypothetical protein
MPLFQGLCMNLKILEHDKGLGKHAWEYHINLRLTFEI